MFARWQSLLEWLYSLLLLTGALAILLSSDTNNHTLIFFGLLLLCTLASLKLRKFNPAPAQLNKLALLEQYMALSLLLTLLYMFYLPFASYAEPLTAWLWLSCQLAIPGLLFRLYRAWRHQPQRINAVDGPHWLVGYASQSGMAQQLASSSAAQLRQVGINVTLAELNTLTQQQLQQYQKALFVVSTYGEGEAPDNASQFFQLARHWQHNLQQLEYAVLALGDRSYQQFCAFGHWLHNWLAHHQANALQPVLELDSTQKQPEALSHWQQLLSRISGSNYTGQQLSDTAPWQQARLNSRYIANPGSSGLPGYIVKLQPEAGSSWQAGDLADIQPENSKCAVALWLTRHQINGCQSVTYRNRQMPLCWALAELQLDKVQAPQAGEVLSDWLATQPQLPLRTYSIASLPEEGCITLLVRQVKQQDGSLGIGSGWLTAWAMEQQPVQLRLRSHSSFHLPDDDRPVIFIANGTGIAGIRSLLASRAQRGHRQNWLIYGERKQQFDSFFARDIQQWQQQGVLSHTDLVFSQDQAEKRYVQHLLAEQAERLAQWVSQGAAIYVCGSLHGMGDAVHQVLLSTLGAESLQQLQQQGRYRRDLY